VSAGDAVEECDSLKLKVPMFSNESSRMRALAD